MSTVLSRLIGTQRGAAAMILGLLLALISIVSLAAFGLTGTNLNSVFSSVARAMNAPPDNAGSGTGSKPRPRPRPRPRPKEDD